MPPRTDALAWLTGLLLACLTCGCAAGLPRLTDAGGPTPPAPEFAPAMRIARATPKDQPADNTRIGSGDPTPSLSTGGDPQARLQALHRAALEKYATIDSYVARLRRREQVNGRMKPEEVILFKFRKEPWSVYFRWLGTEGQGREVVYVKGKYENKLHTLLAAGDVPLMPAGKRLALDPDGVLVKSSSRHPIAKAGIGSLIEKYGQAVEGRQRGDPKAGVLKYLGAVRRPEFAAPCEAVEHLIPPGVEAQLPQGGQRVFYFDPASRLPTLIVTQDHGGQEVEYYCYDRLLFPVKLDEDDFNPAKLWRP